ncbi:MAG TPA: glycosyltransferase family 39 protein [Planctomycetaceae bacterium]|jgi:4-amino-4-deoxy-L-arabinose transferase-like glycosyltransferase|nr:glycosyltransferase family 39 protein [Planctomycetaceae bacterium]
MQAAEQPLAAQPEAGESRGISLTVVLVLFLAAAAIVNPFREMPYDDDWAFSETVKHFLDTGQYRLNEWLAPNMPFQTMWGALFCLPFGYSFSALRISTIVLSVIGLVAFRALALEHGLSRGAANLLTLCLASSPLVFKLTLTYLSDVPFLAMTVVAVLLYTRALRNERWLDWLAASVAASATIFIRQFGIAILGGLALVWLWDRRRFARLGQYGVGALLPTLSTLWQLQQGWNQSNWAQTLLLHRQKAFFWGGSFLKGLPWRIPVLVEYIAWFLLPVALVAALAVWRSLRSTSSGLNSQTEAAATSDGQFQSRARLVTELFGWLILLLASVAYGARVLGVSWVMPYLPWFFEILKLLGLKAELPATLLTIAGGVLFAHFLARRYLVSANRPRLEQGLLDATTFVSLLMALVFFVFGDKDVLIFLPLGAIAVAKQTEPVLMKHCRAVFVACLLLLAGTAVWTREDLCRNQAVWTLAARLEAGGVPSEKIFAGWEWYGYHHFEDYARIVPPLETTEFADFFGPWMERQKAEADYLIVHDPTPPVGEHYKVVDQFQYFSVFSRGIETFYAVERPGSARPQRGPAGGPARLSRTLTLATDRSGHATH